MEEEIIQSLSTLTTHDPHDALDILLESYNTLWDERIIDEYLKKSYRRYKNYKINIDLSSYESILQGINQFIQKYDIGKTYKRDLFNLTKVIDMEIISILQNE